MAFAPIGPVVDKVIEKSVEFVPVIGPGLKYVKTAKKVTKFANPVKATTYTAGMLLEICGYQKYVVESMQNILPYVLYGQQPPLQVQ